MAGWTTKENDAAVKTLAVVCEVTQTSFSESAQKLIVSQLQNYPCRQVLKALERCAAECRYRLTLADILTRLDDGRPGAEEAWGAFPKTEDEAGVVTEEMSTAWGAASHLVAMGDKVGARMAFKEVYEREVRFARASSKPAVWRVSPGSSRSSTEAAAVEGLRRGLLSRDSALQYIDPENHQQALGVAGHGPPALPPPEQQARVKELVAGVMKRLEGGGQTFVPPATEPKGDREP